LQAASGRFLNRNGVFRFADPHKQSVQAFG